MGISEGRSENSASVGRGSNTRLQWQRDTPVCAAGCETDEQGLSLLGLAVEWGWPEVDVLDKREAMARLLKSKARGTDAGNNC